MKRPLLTLMKILNVVPLLIMGLISVTSVQSYSQAPDIEYTNICCGCHADLVPGYFVARVTLTGDAGENVVLCNASMIYDVTSLTAPYTLLPDETAFTEVLPGRYVLEAIIFDGISPSFDLKYEEADGTFETLGMGNPSLPGSCTTHAVNITSDSGTEACSNTDGEFILTATNSQSVDPYGYEWFVDRVSQGPASALTFGTSTFNFSQNMAPGTYIVGVRGYRDPSTCMTTGAVDCEVYNEIVLTITENDSAIEGDANFCRDGLLVKDYNISPNLGPTGSVDWTLKNDDGSIAIATYTTTGAGTTTIDFSALGEGSYVLCASGSSSEGCAVSTEQNIEYFIPEATIEGACDVLCSQTETYNLSVPDGIEPGTVTWVTAPAGNMRSNVTDNSITMTWVNQVGASITVSGRTVDGCLFTQTKEITFLAADAYVTIEGDSDVCMGAIELYTLTSLSDDALDNYNYSWSLKDAGGTDVSAGAVLATTNMGQTVPVDFSSLTPGSYSLMVMATSVGGACPDFMSSFDITIDDGTVPTLACVSSGLNVTIGNNCELEVTADIIIEGLAATNDQFDISLSNAATGEAITGNVLDHSHIGEEILVEVIHECSGNSCWGYLTVEDKSVPVPECPTIIGIVDCEDIADKTNPDFMPIFAADVTVNYQGDDTWELLGYDNCGDATLTCEDENQSTTDCANPSTVFRTWTVTDQFGATASCRVEMQVMYDEDEKVILPSDFDDIIPGAEPSIDVCSDFMMDENGNPHPDMTGYPVGASCADVEVLGYTDRDLPICGSGSPARKILRDWVIWDPCANGGIGDDILHTQYITLTDAAPPICAAFDEFAVVTDSHTCSQTIFVPNPEVANECGSIFIELSYKLRDENGIIPELFETEGVTYSDTDGGFYIEDVQFLSDSLWVLFEVKDACGNGTTDCLTEIALLDNTPPTPVCDLFNNVALNDDGCAYAGPDTFDDHSTDNCGVYQKVIKRMDEGVPCGPCEKPQFDYLTFLGERNGHFYYLSNEPTTGPNSFAYSTAIESYAVDIDDAAEGNWLHTQVSSYTSDSYFIGYRGQGITNADSPSNSDFDAQSGGVMNYDNWATGEPDWSLQGTGDLYVFVGADGTWQAERESVSNHRYVVEIEDPCVFSQRVKFCCADIGNQVMVRMRVFDHYGNFAECMVEVKVQDFKDPTMSNVPDASHSVDCEDLENTDYLLGELSTYLVSEFGEPSFDDNCTIDIDYEVVITPASDCGSFSITRRWTATDTYGNATSFTQIITVGNTQPFVFANINFPNDYDSNNCQNGIEPDELPAANAYPTYSQLDACANVTHSWEDQVFNYTEEACSKILRTWTVIDWCQPDEVWTHIQVIKIYDTEPPTVIGGCQNLSEIEGELVGNCMIETWESGLSYTLSDNCSSYNDVTVWYDLDLNNDGTYESTGVQSDNANGTYPFGTHKLTWYAEDHCGNVLDPCSMTFVVDGDSTGPTAYCLSEIVTVIPVAGSAEIWASDFDQGSFGGGCNTSDDLLFSFSSNTSNTSLSFDCTDITNGGTVDTISLEMWVTDSNGNQSYCDASLILQDNHGICQDSVGSRTDVSGRVYTEDNLMVENVEVSLMEQNNNPMMVDMTNNQGEFAFENVPMYTNYSVNPYSNEDPLNGVSTLDILLIQKHILGLIPITSPYKLIAADVNNSESVSAADLIQIRKLILGVTTEYQSNDSWRFVEQDFVFADATHPWPFEEVIDLNSLNNTMSDADFIAVKIGDVNNSAVVNLVQSEAVSRSDDKVNLELNYNELTTGNTVIEFSANDSYRMDGAQLSLVTGVEPVSLTSEIFDLSESNYAFANGVLTISFNDAKGREVSNGDLVLNIGFDVAIDDLSVSLNESFENEVYVGSTGSVEVKGLDLMSEEYNLVSGFSVFQNTPNPFSNETVIAFEIPRDQPVFMQIFDNSGKVLYSATGEFARGYNEFTVKQSDIQSTGILYYQISTDTHIATRKMIILK